MTIHDLYTGLNTCTCVETKLRDKNEIDTVAYQNKK